MLPQYALWKYSLCCEWPQAGGLIHAKAEFVSLFKSACRVFLRSILFSFQEKLLKSVPLLIIFHPNLGTLKGKMVIGRKWFINGSQGMWLFCFHLHLSLNDKKREAFMWQEGRGKGVYFKKVTGRRRDQKYFCWLTVWSPSSSTIKVRCQ